MKKYIKNKDFIPITFLKKLETKSDKKNNKLILILLILNIFIIPNSISKITDKSKNKDVVPVVNDSNTNKDKNKEKLLLLLKSIDENIKNMKIQNNNGFIEVDSIEKIYEIEEQKIFTIKAVVIKENIVEVQIEL